MKLIRVYLKSMRELFRDPLVLCLTLVFAPCFVLVYSLFFPGGSTTYTILVLNEDRGVQQSDGSHLRHGEQAVAAISQIAYPDGKPLLKTRPVSDAAQAQALLRDRDGVVLVTLPEDFSRSILALQNEPGAAPAAVTFGGDLTNPYYPVAAILATSAIDAYMQEITGLQPPLRLVEVALGDSASRTEFETYVPGMLVFGSIMLIFLAAMTLTREVEAGTLRRLSISRMTSFDLLGGTTLALVLVGVAGELLAFVTALGVGFRSQGSLWAVVLTGALTSLSVVGAGLLVACFSRSVSQAFVIANFPLGFFMLFSGVMYPMPKFSLFSIGERAIGLFDILPPTHAVAALNKIFTFGAGWREIAFELAALAALSIVYFAAGVWLFHLKQMRPI